MPLRHTRVGLPCTSAIRHAWATVGSTGAGVCVVFVRLPSPRLEPTIPGCPCAIRASACRVLRLSGTPGLLWGEEGVGFVLSSLGFHLRALSRPYQDALAPYARRLAVYFGYQARLVYCGGVDVYCYPFIILVNDRYLIFCLVHRLL